MRWRFQLACKGYGGWRAARSQKKNSKIIIKHCRILSVLLHCGSELQGFRGSEWGYLYNTKNLIFFGSVTWSSLHFGKLSKFSIKCFQKKKTGLKRPTLIQNPSGYWVILLVDKNLVHNLKNIAIFFSRAIDVISICNNTKENFLREPEKIKVKSQKRHLHMQFSEFYLFFHNSFEIWHLFSRALTRNSFWCYYRELITAIALEKCKKKAILFKLFWYKVFVHWILKFPNFLVDSVFDHFRQFPIIS